MLSTPAPSVFLNGPPQKKGVSPDVDSGNGLIKPVVISHFPKKRGCPKNRFHNGAMLLLFISKQAEPAFLSKITIGQSQQQSKERCSTEAQSSGAGHTHTLLLAFRLLRRQNSKFSGTWGQILDLLLLLLRTGNKDK